MFRSTVCRSIVVVLATGYLLACGPEPTPTTSPTPSPVASQTPTESAQERQQRVDYEAAEKAYRTFRAEVNKVLARGGAKKATVVMRQTAAGPYLDEYVGLIQDFKEGGFVQKGAEKIQFVRRAGYSPSAIVLDVCEDSRDISTLDKNGKKVGKGEVRTARLEMGYRESDWKIISGDGKRVNRCD